MTVTEPCVSPSTGTLSPDLRVNYAYGMVLGLDEFLQEQLYFLSKDRLHDRSLHGYGTVSGLAVSTAAVPDGDDFMVTVTQGTAIDQWGREIVIRCDQCARLGAWLGAQETAEPGVIAQHLGPSGELTVYVVVSYAECLDALVPLPGQPCSSSDKTMTPSRLRDAWDVELRWAPPPMPRWDTDRRLARLLSSVEIVAGLNPADSDEPEITDAVLALAELADDGPSNIGLDTGPSGTAWRLPAETAAEALDRILTAWLTRVRPDLHPDLEDPEASSDPAILLAELTFVPANPFNPTSPAIVACDNPDENGRPYLLHTQLIQELRLIGQSAGAPVIPEPPDPVQLVTLAASVNDDQRTQIDAWFHLDKPVHLPPTITVTDEDGFSNEFLTSATDANGNALDFSPVWQLTAPDQGVSSRDGLQVSALFPAAGIRVGDPGTTLLDVEAQLDTVFLDITEQGDVSAYAVVRGPVEAPQQPPPSEPVASAEFITITTLLADQEQVLLELWFHLEPRGDVDDAFAIRPAFRLFDEANRNELSFGLSGPAPWSPNVWRVQVTTPDPGKGIPLYLRYVFLAKEFGVETRDGDMSLADWIQKAPALFIGWDPDRSEVIAFSRSDLTAVGRPRILEPFGADVPMPIDRPLRPDIGPAPLRVAAVEPAAAKKAAAKKAPAKKTARAPAKKAPAKKSAAKKAPAKKAGGGNR